MFLFPTNRKMTLRKKLIITSLACLLLPTILMLYTTSIYSKWIIKEHTLGNATQSLTIVKTQIDGILEELVSVSNFIQFDAEIKTLLENAKTDTRAIKQLTMRLEQVAGEKNDLQLTLLVSDGRAFSDYSFHDFKPQHFFDKEWFSNVLQLSAFDTLFVGAEPNYLPMRTANQQFVVIAARALLEDISKTPYAYLIVSRVEYGARELFQNLSEDVYLIDEHNRIVSNRDPGLIGQSFHTIIDDSKMTTPNIIRSNGEDQIYISIPLHYAGWRLVSVAPYNQMTEKLNNISNITIIVQIVLVGGFVIISMFLLRRFTKPVQDLGEIAKQVITGDLSIRSNIRGNDEVGLLGRSFDKMLDQIQLTLSKVQIEQELKRKAELSLLQTQIHPHFLFNVLSSIRMKLLMNKDGENAHLIGSLSSLLRTTIAKKDEFISLRAELNTITQYTELMNFTMLHPIELMTEIHPDVLHETVPRFIIQPVIENTYKHAFASDGGIIYLRIHQKQSRIIITIEDDGEGMEAAVLEALQKRLKLESWEIIDQFQAQEGTPSSGIGLSNVYDRLKLIYGDAFEMHINSVYMQGTSITIILPIQRTDGEHHV